MPDLHDLDDFSQGLPTVNPLPPSEVRRRGDRLRRRRAALAAGAGVLAAAVAIGTPVVALSGSDGRDDPSIVATDPSATQTPTNPLAPPPGGWPQSVPAGFPLTDGFADESVEGRPGLEGDPGVPAGCGTAFEGYVDDLVASYQGGSEDREVRYLAVFPTAAAAGGWLTEVVGTIEDCAPTKIARGTSMVHAVDPLYLGVEESWRFVQQVRHDDGLLSDLTLAVVWREGNAVYIDSSYGAAGGDQVIEAETDRLIEASNGPVAAMCAFSAFRPCAD